MVEDGVVTGREWAHMLVFVDALAAAGNAPSSDGFQATQGGWDCVMQRALDFDVVQPLLGADVHPVVLVPDEDMLWCRHCWASIIGPGGLLTRGRLVAVLDREGVSRDAYGLDGGHPNEQYVLDHRGTRWVVYYSERGLETGRQEYATAADAYAALLRLVLADPTTRGS